MGVLQEDIDFLEHHGVKGMRWGVRNDKENRSAKKLEKRTRRVQNRVDSTRRVARGKGTTGDKLNMALNNYTLVDAVKGRGLTRTAQARLDRAQLMQSRIANGEMRVTAMLQKMGGVPMSAINYSYK